MKKIYLILLVSVLYVALSSGQNRSLMRSREALGSQIEEYISEMKALGSNLGSTRPEQLKIASRSANVLDTKWTDFLQDAFESISEDDRLLELVVEYEQARDATLDSISIRKLRIEKTTDFVKAEKLIKSKRASYQEMEKNALALSLVKQSAPMLERLKAEEQISFMDVSAAFQTAREAAAINPVLKGRMAVLQSEFIDIRNSSSKIQEMEFKPFVERIKDYIMSLAAFAIIMMFLVFIGNYIKAAKTAKESARKMEELLHKNDGETPTI